MLHIQYIFIFAHIHTIHINIIFYCIFICSIYIYIYFSNFAKFIHMEIMWDFIWCDTPNRHVLPTKKSSEVQVRSRPFAGARRMRSPRRVHDRKCQEVNQSKRTCKCLVPYKQQLFNECLRWNNHFLCNSFGIIQFTKNFRYLKSKYSTL